MNASFETSTLFIVKAVRTLDFQLETPEFSTLELGSLDQGSPEKGLTCILVLEFL